MPTYRHATPPFWALPHQSGYHQLSLLSHLTSKYSPIPSPLMTYPSTYCQNQQDKRCPPKSHQQSLTFSFTQNLMLIYTQHCFCKRKSVLLFLPWKITSSVWFLCQPKQSTHLRNRSKPRENSAFCAITKYQDSTFLISTGLTQHTTEQASKFTNSLFQAEFKDLKHDSSCMDYTRTFKAAPRYGSSADTAQAGANPVAEKSQRKIPAQEQLFISGQG